MAVWEQVCADLPFQSGGRERAYEGWPLLGRVSRVKATGTLEQGAQDQRPAAALLGLLLNFHYTPVCGSRRSYLGSCTLELQSVEERRPQCVDVGHVHAAIGTCESLRSTNRCHYFDSETNQITQDLCCILFYSQCFKKNSTYA